MVTLETSKLFGQLPAHELKPLQAVTQQRKAEKQERKGGRREGGRGPGLMILLGTLLIIAIVATSVTVV